MSNSLLKYELEIDEIDGAHDYLQTDHQWVSINDLNSANYSGGYINWNNVAVQGSSYSKTYLWKQAYAAIPITTTLEITSAGTTFNNVAANVFAVAPKGWHQLVDLANVKFNGIQVSHNAYMNNLYQNEKLKEMSEDEYKLVSEIICHSFDTPQAVGFSDVYGEYANNTTKPTNLVGGLAPGIVQNKGYVERVKKAQIDMSDLTRTSLGQFGALTSKNMNSFQSALVSYSGTKLTFQYMALVPLCYIHPVFKEMPATSSSQGFEIRLQLNCGSENSYIVTYDKGTLKPTNVASTQVVGRTCPWMIAPLSTDGSSGLGVTVAAQGAVDPVLKLSSKIGWDGTGNGASNIPCRLWIPTINLAPEVASARVSNPIKTMMFNDYYIDNDLAVKTGTQRSRLFNSSINRPRKLYILPFINTSGITTAASPLVSPLSSAGNTVSPCKFRNVTVSVGGSPILYQPLNSELEQYMNNYLINTGKFNGNAFDSVMFGNQITKSMWSSGAYGTIIIDLDLAEDVAQDSLPHSLQIQYTIEGDGSKTYDVYYMIEYSNTLQMDKISGEVTRDA